MVSNKSHEEKNLETMSKATNYNRWMFSNLSRYIGKNVLEIGGGIGNMTRLLLPGRKLVVSTDITGYNLRILKSRFKNRRSFFAVNTDISKDTAHLRRFSFDTVVCINVLEHIEKDVAALKNMNSLLNKGGKLVLLVPAFSALYGTIDKADGHHRRYDKKKTIKKVEAAGFEVMKCFYMNLPGFFGWFYHGRVLKAGLHPEGDISLFDKLVPIFSFFERILHPPFGLSLVVIARKM